MKIDKFIRRHSQSRDRKVDMEDISSVSDWVDDESEVSSVKGWESNESDVRKRGRKVGVSKGKPGSSVCKGKGKIGKAAGRIDLEDLLDYDRARREGLDFIPYRVGVQKVMSKTLEGGSRKSRDVRRRSRDRSSESGEESDRGDRSRSSSDDTDSDAAGFPPRREFSSSRWGNWIRYEDPYEIVGDGSGGYALRNRDKRDIV